jgi:hypothetical protein
MAKFKRLGEESALHLSGRSASMARDAQVHRGVRASSCKILTTSEWREDFKKLSSCKNVAVEGCCFQKLSGRWRRSASLALPCRQRSTERGM